MTRWLTSLCVALGLAVLGGIAPMRAAQATPVSDEGNVSISAFSDCPDGWSCAWDYADGMGRMMRTQISIDDLGDMDNRISVLWNRTGVRWCAYDMTGFTGPVLWVGNAQVSDLRWSDWDNKISSLRRGCL